MNVFNTGSCVNNNNVNIHKFFFSDDCVHANLAIARLRARGVFMGPNARGFQSF